MTNGNKWDVDIVWMAIHYTIIRRWAVQHWLRSLFGVTSILKIYPLKSCSMEQILLRPGDSDWDPMLGITPALGL